MKLFLKIVAVILAVFVLGIGGGIFYLTRGLETGKNLEIGHVDLKGITNGTYDGKYDGGRWSNEVKVLVENGKITNVDIVKSVLFDKPEVAAKLFDKVIKEQDTTVDAVSGATVTSKAYLKSVENALTR